MTMVASSQFLVGRIGFADQTLPVVSLTFVTGGVCLSRNEIAQN
jgi:hypothetical protein